MSVETNGNAMVRVLVPVPREVAPSPAPAVTARRGGSSGFVIGFLDNHKRNSDRVLRHLEARLAALYPEMKIRRAVKPEACKPAPHAVLEDLAQHCQAVVNGIAD